MSKTILFCLCFIHLFCISSIAAELKNGFNISFADGGNYLIEFGSTKYDEAEKQLRRRYLDRQVLAFGPGSDFYKKVIFLSDFKLGDKTVTVNFLFDYNEYFFKFQFDTKGETANMLETEVYKAGDYLTEILTKKYGKLSSCYEKPNILSIKEGHISLLCLWKDKDLGVTAK